MGYKVYSYCSGYGHVADRCEHGNELQVPQNAEICVWPSNFHIFKKELAPWSS
jgi:hypothetical protein